MPDIVPDRAQRGLLELRQSMRRFSGQGHRLPLSMNSQCLGCDEMIEACRRAGVKLMYAEELCFAHKYVRAKELADEGALGRVYYVRQLECHYGPHSDWFWDVNLSGGGVLMDMGCHSIKFARWVFDNAPVESVYAEVATYVHGE